MKKHILNVLMAAASLTLMSSAGHAATSTDDGFGGSTYFTAQAPEALSGTPSTNALASKTDDDAAAVSQIEPAAGDNNYGVFSLPDDPAAAAPVPAHTGEILNAPSEPIVPGQTVTKSTN